MSSPPALRRSPAERLAAWFATGPVGHLYAFVADLGELLARFALARARERVRRRLGRR